MKFLVIPMSALVLLLGSILWRITTACELFVMIYIKKTEGIKKLLHHMG